MKIDFFFQDDTSLDSLDLSGQQQQQQMRDVRISPANTDLLFKLFENAEQQNNGHYKSTKLHHLTHSQYKLYRAALATTQKPMKSVCTKGMVSKGEDPSMVDAVSEGLFPLLRLDSRNTDSVNHLLMAFKYSLF